MSDEKLSKTEELVLDLIGALELSLKPCPLCEASARIVRDKDGDFSVECSECGLGFPFVPSEELSTQVENWSTRPEDSES